MTRLHCLDAIRVKLRGRFADNEGSAIRILRRQEWLGINRAALTNEKKLEQYGVWVKVKPREVIKTPSLDDSFQLSDLETSKAATATAPADDEEGNLTAEEEQLLDELETELVPEDTAENVFVPEEEPLLDEGELPGYRRRIH